ncbi:MAG: RagB/SusD family nutrient uptake outer membrane protein [Bacteroidales bacterium]|nr:RagB/SusD family nutrient uptake outer membrane protein [Bacteroidales bacterium]
MRKILIKSSLVLAVALSLFGVNSCNKYLNVVPDDGIATLDMAFNLRASAIRYLATCYSYMPIEGNVANDPAMLTGDELWDLVGRVVSNTSARVPNTYFNIARGFQSASRVYANDWADMYQGIRCCDILVENIDNVPDMTDMEKEQWKAEATFLKAYYHFNLVRKWGPVPIIRESLPIDSDVETVRVYRDNIDDCFDYILELLDQAEPNLPLMPESSDMYGRITKAICKALKAKVAVYAASPLFNGNEEEASLVDNRGVQLFPDKDDDQKLERWRYALTACKEAIEVCEQANMRLYDDSNISYRVTDSLKRTLTLRNAFNQRQTAQDPIEVVWPNTQISSTGSTTAFQMWTMPNMTGNSHTTGGYRFIGVPLKIVDQFYTKNGLPINNDLEWQGVNSQEITSSPSDHSYYIVEGYKTIRHNIGREPRYYSYLGFDGGIWYGEISNFNDVQPSDLPHIECRNGGPQGKSGSEVGPVTGYFAKKLYPQQCNFTGTNTFVSYWFPWPVIRLTDLYLLYAEAINEAEGPNGAHRDELFRYLDAVRERAGIPDVKDSWDNYSNNPGYYDTQYGMRSIIHRERLIELTFESQRFWDIRRWKEAPAEYQKGIYGYTVTGSSPEDYYVRKLIASQTFGLKDYFWPIYNYYLERNPNLVQNLGW